MTAEAVKRVEILIPLKVFRAEHKFPACRIIAKTIILSSAKVDPSDGNFLPEFYDEEVCLTHQVFGTNLPSPKP